MWSQWTWWLMSCERDFTDEAGTVPYVVWESVQPWDFIYTEEGVCNALQ